METAFALSDTHRQFRDSLRRFAEDRVAPQAAAPTVIGLPPDVLRRLPGAGVPALGIPEAYGGAGADMVTQAIMAEELARVCASTAVTLLISKLGMLPVMNLAGEDLKRLPAEGGLGRVPGAATACPRPTPDRRGPMRTRASGTATTTS